MKRVELGLSVSAMLLCATTAGAQRPAGRLTGTVTATNGGGLTGVTVSARNRANGRTREAISGPDGTYEISDLPDGSYSVQAEIPGIAPVVRDNVTLVPGGSVEVDFILRGAIAETVAVTARTPPGEQDRATIEQIIGERLVHSLPLIGRDFLDLVSLTAGFTGNPRTPSPHGQIFWSNNVLVDGASHFSKWRSAARTFYSGYGLESIKEVQVLSSQFSAEFGEALATVTNVITNSGSNELRGTGLLFVQDDALNAVPVFVTGKPASDSQRFGLTLGGPVVRDRTHFFSSYEGWRARGHNIVVSPLAPEALAPNNEDQHLLFWKLDHRASERHVFTGRYNGQWFRWHDETGGLALPGTGVAYRNDVHTLLFTDTFVISNQLLSQARIQFARYVDVRRDLQPSVYVSRAGYSIEGGLLGPWGFGADPEDSWEAANTFSLSHGDHSVKFGGGFKHVGASNTSLAYGHGAYFFAGSPASYPQPYSFIQAVAPSSAALTANPRGLAGFGFLQDEWRAHPKLTLNVGLRYDIERISNVGGYEVPADKNNIQPRLSASWDPNGAGQTVIRGGVGLYTQQHLLYYINRVQLEGPDGAITLSLVPGAPLMPVFPDTLPPTLATVPPRDIQLVNDRFRNPYSLQVAAGIERLLFGFLFAADYLHLTGRDLMSLVDLNAPESVQKPAQRDVAEADATRPLIPVENGFRKVMSLGNEGLSWYHALQVKANRASGRFLMVSSYTFASAQDQVNYQIPEDSRNIPAERGPADQDIRHNLSVGMSWQMPGEGRFRSGWTLSSLAFFRTSQPYTMSWGDDRNGTTQNDARPGGRNTVRGDAFKSVDLAATKRLTHARLVFELRAEIFNALSTTNYDQYVGTLSSPAFGTPISAFPRRRVQLAAIVRF